MILKFDGVDVSSWFDEETVHVDVKPVTTAQVQTLDGVTHDSVIRWKSTWSAKVLPLTREQAISLSSMLRKTMMEVTYESPHYGEVIQNMRVSYIPYDTALKYNDLEYWNGGTLSLEER